MNPVVALIIGLLAGAVIGALAVLALRRRPQQAVEQAPDLRPALAAAEATAAGLREQVVRYEEELRQREEREREQNRVLVALEPVRQAMQTMQQKVTELELQRSRQHGELSEQLRNTAESEERLRRVTSSLASALTSNSTRGAWGEIQLRSVAESAGMLEHVDFDTQASITAESGARRPDMVVHLPGGKHIAVDSKAPFNAFLEASAIDPTATGAEGAHRAALLKEHVKAVRDHVTALSGKSYWSGLDNSPELTIAFIPSESLISSALEADPSLLEFAFSKQVALASPVTLWSVLKAVAFSWRQDVLTNEAKTLFDLSKELYSRLSTTAGHIERLGRSIESTVKNYNGFVGSMERQVLPSARKIGALREENLIAELSAVEEPVRQLAAPELVVVPEPPEEEERAAS